MTDSTGEPATVDVRRPDLSLADFDLIRRLGEGSYSHVVLAKHKATEQKYALKVIDKHHIIRHDMVSRVQLERRILSRLTYDGIVRIYFTFQDAISLYIGLEYLPNGELYDQIRIHGALEESTAAFYAAEIVSMLENLRKEGVVHRDVKPENLLLTDDGHLKLIDFGSAKEVPPQVLFSSNDSSSTGEEKAAAAAAVDDEDTNQNTATTSDDDNNSSSTTATAAVTQTEADPTKAPNRPPRPQNTTTTTTAIDPPPGEPVQPRKPLETQLKSTKRLASLVGTADYVSPEVLENSHPVSYAVDLWALGCVLYQMLSGRPPFKAPSEYLTFQKITSLEYTPLPESITEESRDLVSKLLRLNPCERLGCRDLKELKAHPFFESIDWENIRTGDAPEPAIRDDESVGTGSATSSFDWELQSLAAAMPRIASGLQFRNSIEIPD